MDVLWENYAAVIIPLAYVVGGYVCGLLFQVLFVHRLYKWSEKTNWKWDDILIKALGNMPIIWFVILGGFFAIWDNHIGNDYYPVYYNTLMTIFLLTVTVVIARLASGAIQRIPTERLPSTSLFVNGSKFLIYIIGFIIILQNLNVEITPMITALGIGGLAVALALEETLSNLFSGVQIIASQLVRPGDYVKLAEGYTGYVTDVKARNTTILSFPDENRIIIPNSTLSSSVVINYSMPERNMWLEIPVGVAYDSDLQHVEEVTIEVAKEVGAAMGNGVGEQDPIFRYEEFGDSSINFKVRIFVTAFRDQFITKHEFIKALHRRFAAENIEIPFPIRTVYMKNNA